MAELAPVKTESSASSRGAHLNSGNGPTMQPVDIGHSDYVALLDPDAAFWSLVKKEKLAEALADSALLKEHRRKRDRFLEEMNTLRFGLKPQAVYFNLTERCNLNCSYCYIPEKLRRKGVSMSEDKLSRALKTLRRYFKKTLPPGRLAQVIFHGSEPMLCREALFSALDEFGGDFNFGIQTNGTLLDEEAIQFLTSRGISVGLSLDGHRADISKRTRKTWGGEGIHHQVIEAIERLKGYPNYSVICTATSTNMRTLSSIVDFFHGMEIPTCMLNPVRCTLPGAREVKPSDHQFARHFLKALDRTFELYEKTGRKLIVANFANILISILAPAARRLMCDISPCGGGRCFFAVSAQGDLYPCSEFIGLPAFKGGSLFNGGIEKALASPACRAVTGRKVEDIEPCRRCAVRHFCGSPCPAEAHEMNGGMDQPGAFCELYEEQVRYALRAIADGRQDAYLWDNWDTDTETSLEITSL